METYFPVISIIVPVFNTEEYIERCIYSILQQSYKYLDIICIDDGSTDSSGVLLDKFAKEDARVRVIHQKNQGIANARNTGLNLAKGKYIGFVDSDDYIDPEMYQILLNAIQKEKVDIVSCGYYFDINGDIKQASNLYRVPEIPINTKDFLIYIYKRDEYKGVAGYLWTRLFKADLLKKNNDTLEFQKELKEGEDIVFLAEAIIRSKKNLYIDKPLYYYFQREKSATHNEKIQLESLSWVIAYEKILNLYEKFNVNDNVIEAITRMYVYRCGKIMELSISSKDKIKYNILKDKISNKLDVYVRSNIDKLERVKWIIELLLYKWEI